MATIFLTGGGTAGHCTPNMALLPYLKNYFDKIIYIGSENGIEKNIVQNYNIPYFSISCAKLKRHFSFSNLLIPFSLFKGVKQSVNLIKKYRPDIIFSKGGFVSLPLIIAGNKMNIPVITHESDYSVGLANKIGQKYCKKVLTSFPETAKKVKNGEYVGSPLKKSLFNVDKNKALKFFGFNGNKPIILIMGGSLGSKAINDAVWQCIFNLVKDYDVIHICGKNNLKSGVNLKGYYKTEYLSNIEDAIAVSDICISRAGSNSVFELMALKKLCIFIPLPKGHSRGDQIENAEYFKSLNLATVLYQEDLTPQNLLNKIDSTYKKKEQIKKNFEKYKITDASRKITQIIVDCMR